ncbi:MAG: hypothetical protein WBQ69_10130 [Gallionella sp.]
MSTNGNSGAESAAKEKELRELYAQIAATEMVIEAATQEGQSAIDGLLRQVQPLEMSPVDSAIGFAVISFSALVFGYRKFKSKNRVQPEAPGILEDGGYPRLSVINQDAAFRIERPMKTPSFADQKTQSILRPNMRCWGRRNLFAFRPR